MRCLLTAFTIVALAAASATAIKPIDIPCVTWIKSNSNVNTPDPSDLFAAAHTTVEQYSPTECVTQGEIFPCFADKEGVYNWGHHDYAPDGQLPADSCRTYVNGSVTFANTFYLPKKGPKYQTWKWHTAKKGGSVPNNAIRYGSAVMARSLVAPPGQCAGKGFTGWALGQKDGTFGDVHFSIVQQPFTTDTFEVAVCEAYHPTPVPSTPVPPTPEPTMPATTVSPTLPPSNKPYIRFANTVPSPNKITATINQGNASYTWTDYGFGEFSKWVEIFAPNVPGTITLVSGGKQLLVTSVILPPGPLVVAVKNLWPPVQNDDVETIAASYVPMASGSGARLFNLSPDTQAASMSSGGKTLAQDIIYADGSGWANVPAASAKYTVTDFNSGKVLATNTVTAPPNPFVFSNFLIGLSNTSMTAFKTKLVALVDAPEF